MAATMVVYRSCMVAVMDSSYRGYGGGWGIIKPTAGRCRVGIAHHQIVGFLRD